MSEINVTPFVDVMLVLLIILWLQPRYLQLCSSRFTRVATASSMTRSWRKHKLKGEIYIQEHHDISKNDTKIISYR